MSEIFEGREQGNQHWAFPFDKREKSKRGKNAKGNALSTPAASQRNFALPPLANSASSKLLQLSSDGKDSIRSIPPQITCFIPPSTLYTRPPSSATYSP